MSIRTTAYCDNPTCSASTTHVQSEAIISANWVTANIADLGDEWFQNSKVHARHYCGYECYRFGLAVEGLLPEYETQQDMIAEFKADETRLQDST